jgi:hypothetical protein
MGAKTWMLTYSSGSAREILKSDPRLDREATAALAKALFPDEKLELLGDADLSFTCPPDDELIVGCFPGLTIVAAQEFGIDYPSQLPSIFLDHASGRTVHLHAMHSAVDWLAFAMWSGGELRRSLSLSPDSGVLEDIGPRLSFEEPYWSGQRPAIDPEEEDDEPDYPFAFHPLELGEAALREFFGYELEGMVDDTLLEPELIPLLRYKRS